jgi:hypothetical protein
MKKILLPLVTALGFTAGCYTQGDVGMRASYSSGGGYYASGGPQLYYYSPGVSVVAYSDDPVFYSDNYYYRYYDGVWYQSPYYNSGWSVAYNVPYGVRSIDRPHTYARFQPGRGWTRVNAGTNATGYTQGGVQVRDHRNNGYYRPAPGPAVRDHRTYQPAPAPAPVVRDHRTYQPAPAPAPAPVVRDHRTNAPSPAPAPAPAPRVRDHRR